VTSRDPVPDQFQAGALGKELPALGKIGARRFTLEPRACQRFAGDIRQRLLCLFADGGPRAVVHFWNLSRPAVIRQVLQRKER
jgi:hypothetical protein